MKYFILMLIFLHYSATSVYFSEKPEQIIYTRNSILANPGGYKPLHIGNRARYATCGGVAWFHDDNYIASVNLFTSSINIYSIDIKDLTIKSLVNNTRLNRVADPENITFSPDEKLIAITNSRNGEVNIYDVNINTHLFNHSPLATLKVPQDINCHGVSFSPDGEFLVYTTVDNPGYIRLYKIIKADGHIEFVPFQNKMNNLGPLKPKGIAFSPNGKWIAISYASNARVKSSTMQSLIAIYGFDQLSGIFQEPVSISNDEHNLNGPEDINFTQDGSQLLVTNQANDTAVLIAIDPHTGVLGPVIQTLKNPEAALSFPHGNAFSHNGKYVAIANYGEDKITIYEVEK